MKRILSKKLVPAIVVSAISLQFIPFNVFAVSSLGSKTTTTTDVTPISKNLSDTEICLRGEYSGSSPNKVTIGFDTEKCTIKLNKGNTIVNSHFKKTPYITVNLFNESGGLKKSFTLKGDDYPIFNDSVKTFDGQKFEIGDYLTVYHADPKDNVLIFSKVNGNKSNILRKDFTKDELKESIFKINSDGLHIVKKQITTEFKESRWTENNDIVMIGYARTNFGKSDNKELIIKGSNGVTKTIDIKEILLNTDKDDSDKFNVEIPSDILAGLKPGTYSLEIGCNQNGQRYTHPLKCSTMQPKTILDKSYLSSSHCNHRYNKCRLGYQLINDNGSVKLEVELKDCSCSHKCDCLNK